MMLNIDNLEVHYGKAKSLHGVSLAAEKGSIIAVIGPVGAGKSTLMDAVLGLNDARGTIEFNGQDITRQATAQIVDLGIGYAPERGNLFAHMGVKDNLLVGAYTARADISRNLDLVFDLFPILKERQRQDTGTQSGGERQMVSLGRALMTSPRLLLVDEPTIGLAPKVCDDIAKALQRLNKEHGLTIVIAEQNVNFGLSLAEDIYLLETGRITRHGTSDALQSEDTIRQSYFGH